MRGRSRACAAAGRGAARRLRHTLADARHHVTRVLAILSCHSSKYWLLLRPDKQAKTSPIPRQERSHHHHIVSPSRSYHCILCVFAHRLPVVDIRERQPNLKSMASACVSASGLVLICCYDQTYSSKEFSSISHVLND